MKHLLKISGIIVIAAVIGFGITACGDSGGGSDNPPGPSGPTTPNLSGNVTITNAATGEPVTTIPAPATLIAVYSGTETVGFQWNQNSAPISGANTATLTATAAGSYTVTVSAGGFNPKTSAAVSVTIVTDDTHRWYSTTGKTFDATTGWQPIVPAEVIEDGYRLRECSGNGPSHIPHTEKEYREFAKGTPGFKYQLVGDEYTLVEVPATALLTGTDINGDGNMTGTDISPSYDSSVKYNEAGTIFIAAWWREPTQTTVEDYKRVTKIDESVFTGRTGVTKAIFLPGSQLREIGNNAFNATGLTEIAIPATVTVIDHNAFENNEELTKVDFLDNRITIISSHLFNGCVKLGDIRIPTSVTLISESAFKGAAEIKSVQIPKGVTAIHQQAFKDCSKLSSVTYSWDPACIVSTIGQQAFDGCVALTGMIIHPSVKTIGEEAFKGCVAFGNIEIPSTVEAINNAAFSGWGGTSGSEKTQKIIIRKASAYLAARQYNVLAAGETWPSESEYNGNPNATPPVAGVTPNYTSQWDAGITQFADPDATPAVVGVTIEFVAP